MTANSEIVVQEGGLAVVSPSWYTVHELGLDIPDDAKPSADEFCEAWLLGDRIKRHATWRLVDLLAFGESTYGDELIQIADLTGYTKGSLYNLRWLGRVPLSRRRDIPVSYHAAVLSLPIEEQDRLLDMAADEKMSRDELRSLVRESKMLAAGIDPEDSDFTVELTLGDMVRAFFTAEDSHDEDRAERFYLLMRGKVGM